MTMTRRRTPSRRFGAAEFKARCLELIDRVNESRTEVIVTRHGRPVARLVPFETVERHSLVGSMANSVLRFDGPFDPVPAAWSVETPDDGAGA
jgi:prevent-host-death family protein